MLVPSSLISGLSDYHFPAYPSVTGLLHPITARSIAGFFYALAWGWLLLVAFIGWGRFTGKLFRIERLPASIACSLGIAVVIFLGGLLNLADAIYAAILFALIAIGLILYATRFGDRPVPYRWNVFWRSAAPWARILLICVLVILVLRVAATVRLAEFDINDDSSAYLVFPQQILAAHNFAPGPFSDRHVISSLGGGYLLQAFVLVATSLANIGMADRTLGLILLLVALWDFGIAFGLSFEQIAIVELLAYLIPQQTANLTFVILPVVLLLSVLWLIFHTLQEEKQSWRYALLAGAIGGATVALKSTFLPSVGAFCLIPYCMMNWRKKKLAFGLPLVAGIGAILVIAAWMIALKLSTGTYLYPILGRGLDYSHYGLFRSFSIAKTPRTIIKLFLHAFMLFALGGVLIYLGWRKRKARFSLSVLLGAALGITAFNLASGGDSIWRYDFPTFFSAMTVYSIACIALSQKEGLPQRKTLALAVGVLSLMGCIFYQDISGVNPRLFRQSMFEISRYGSALRASLSGQTVSSPALREEYHAVEASIPKDGVALEDVGDPFLFNFKTHKIFVMDWPGAAGPAPGWPFGRDSAALAQYLQQNSVRYVLYDYQYAHWIDAKSCQVIEIPQRYSTELYVLFWMSLLSQNQLDHLRRNYYSIYDDGKIAVMDLAHPIAKDTADRPVWTLNTNKDAVCSAVMARYLASALARTIQ